MPRATGASYSRSRPTLRYSSAATSTRVIKMSEAADPNGQLRAVENWFWIRFPTNRPFAPPRRSDVRNDPSAGMNTSNDPATSPGPESGNVTRQNRAAGLAPRTSAASSSDGSIFSSDAYTGRIRKGRYPYTSPANTAKGVYSISIGCLMMPRPISQLLTSPVSRMRKIMANVRTRKLVQNGSTTRNNSRVRHLPLLVIAYATGYPASTQNAVVSTAITNVRSRMTRYTGCRNRAFASSVNPGSTPPYVPRGMKLYAHMTTTGTMKNTIIHNVPGPSNAHASAPGRRASRARTRRLTPPPGSGSPLASTPRRLRLRDATAAD